MDTDRPPVVIRVTSPLMRERGRVRVAPSGYPASLGKTPHLDPLLLPKGRGVAKHYVGAQL